MSRTSLLLICVLLFVSDCKGAISDKRLCGDPTCAEPVAYAKTLLRYASDDARILSFQGNVKATVFSKSAGTRPDLWGVEINGKRGYVPKDFIREYQVVKSKLEHVVSTRDDIMDTRGEQDLQVNGDLEEPPPDNELKLPPFPNIGAAAEQMKENIPLSSETLEPYEVADGTTIYYSTDAPAEPVLIQATTTDSSVQPTIQSQLDSNPKNDDVDKPNPSMVLPQPSTSSDVTNEKEEIEGSASEKIYKYILSNFVSEEGSGELTKEEEILAEHSSAETNKGDAPDELGQKVFIESTESGPVPISIEPPGSIIESEGNTKHQVSLSPASIEPVEKAALNESVEEDDDDDADVDAEGNEEDDEYADSDEITYSGEPSPDSVMSSPGSDNGHDGSLPPIETEKFKRDISDDNKSENQDPHVDTLPSSIGIDVKSEHSANVVSEIVHDSTSNTLNEGNSQFDNNTKVHEDTLEQISDNVEQMDNSSHVEVVEEVESVLNETQSDDSAGVENVNTLEPATENPLDSRSKPHDLEDGSTNEAVEKTTEHFTLDSTPFSLSESQNPETVSETTLDPHPDMMLTSTETSRPIDVLDQNEKVLPEKDTSNIIPDTMQETYKPSVGESLDSPTPPTRSESGGDVINVDIESSVDHNGFNDTITSQSLDLSTVEPGSENMLDEIPQSNVLEGEETEEISEFSEDESVLVTITTEDYAETGYVDALNEDSPLNVVTDTPGVKTEYSSEAATEDISETSGGFFSNMFGGWFGSSSTPEEVEVPVEVVEENAGSEADISTRNSVWSYTRQPDINHKPETPSSCLADSGIDPDCDKVLLPGNLPRVDSDNEAAIQQVMTAQDTNIPPTETWGYDGGSSQILSYLAITAVSMVVIIVGHWFIEKMRCDSTYIKRINNLERALLYAELESKNLKIDLEESQYNNSEDQEIPENVTLLEEELEILTETLTCLEEKNAGLEEKNNVLQSSLDVATEAGLELNRMLSDLLSTNKGSESLIGSVNDLQQQLNSQQATISNMKVVLNTKEVESESLRNNLAVSQRTIKSLELELNQLTETLNDLLVEKSTQENQFKCIKDELDAKLKSNSVNEDKLAKEIVLLQSKIAEMESYTVTQDIEMGLLRQCICGMENGSNFSTTEFKQIFDVATAESASRKLLEEKDRLSDALQGETDARKLLEGHVEVITKEVDMLRKAVEQSEKEKVEAVTKHAVLADYFKDKESQLHKELGYRDALYMQTKGDATMTHEEVKSLHEQLESYKSQIDTLKKEIVDQERGLKSQILAFEKKSHENWLVARQAERKLQESKLEAGLLRNRLTIVEKNASNAVGLQNDKVLINNTGDREMLDPNIGSGTAPLLYHLDMNVANAPAYATRVQPVPPHGPLSPVNHLVDENLYRMWPNVDSPSPNSRAQPAPCSLPPRISPANPVDITFTLEDALNPASPFYGILSPSAPYDPFHGRPIQDRHNPDLYHIMPLLPFMSGPAPIMLPPPVLPNLPASHDRRPPPLGRMSSPPPGGRISPPPPHAHLASPVRGRLSSPFPEPSRRMSPPDRRHRRSPAHRYASPERPQRGPRPRGGSSLERERRRSIGSTGRVSPFEQTSTQDRGRRSSLTPRGPFDHSTTQERTVCPEHGRPYRRRSPTPSGRYSDSSPDSAPDSRRYPRRYDYSPESSYIGRSRSPSPTGFRPISREASNNQGSNRGSNHSYESDESTRRRGGRL